MALDQRHHAFLQSLMSRGPQPACETKNMFRKLFDLAGGNVEEEFFEFLGKYNKVLDPLQLEIRGSTNQYDGSQFYGLVNKNANEEAKMGTRYSYPQISFFKALLEALVHDASAGGQISGIEALNVRQDSDAVKLSLSQKQAALKELIRDKWLGQTSEGAITLGVRSFLELRAVFKNLEVPFCDVCNEAAIKAARCHNGECSVRMHSYCARRKFEHPEVPRNCSGCGTSWDCSGLDLDQSRIAKTEQVTSGRKASSKKRRRRDGS